jgi:hypothetical protein
MRRQFFGRTRVLAGNASLVKRSQAGVLRLRERAVDRFAAKRFDLGLGLANVVRDRCLGARCLRNTVLALKLPNLAEDIERPIQRWA